MKNMDDWIAVRNALAKIFCKLGIRDVDAIILAELIMYDENMSVEMLKKRLNYSISGITSSLHRLMRLHLVARSKKGKKYLYKSESNILSILIHLIEEIRKYDMPLLKRKLEKAKENNELKKKMETLSEKIKKAEEYLSSLILLFQEYEGVIT
ncbi:MAG: transcriptional regulator [Thermoplasmata archaeon]|nr:transcriptional regulator [Thermoplasmata archaeon]